MNFTALPSVLAVCACFQLVQKLGLEPLQRAGLFCGLVLVGYGLVKAFVKLLTCTRVCVFRT